jgi:hypothetical protein
VSVVAPHIAVWYLPAPQVVHDAQAVLLVAPQAALWY